VREKTGQEINESKTPVDNVIKDIRRATRKGYSAEENPHRA